MMCLLVERRGGPAPSLSSGLRGQRRDHVRRGLVAEQVAVEAEPRLEAIRPVLASHPAVPPASPLLIMSPRYFSSQCSGSGCARSHRRVAIRVHLDGAVRAAQADGLEAHVTDQVYSASTREPSASLRFFSSVNDVKMWLGSPSSRASAASRSDVAFLGLVARDVETLTGETGRIDRAIRAPEVVAARRSQGSTPPCRRSSASSRSPW